MITLLPHSKRKVTSTYIVFFFLPLSFAVIADEYFDPAALENINGEQKIADLNYFSSSEGQHPGKYKLSVYLNNEKVDDREINLVMLNNKLLPELSSAYLHSLGVNTSAFEKFNALGDKGVMVNIGEYIPQGYSAVDFSQLRIDISIPQAAMISKSHSYVSPDKWDNGINAAYVDYNLNGASSSLNGLNSNRYYLNLRSGINLSAWQIRNTSTYLYEKKGNWKTQSLLAQRNIASIKSVLRIGDTATSSDIFDSVRFNGLKISSDDAMLPDSEKGFAPVVRGVAYSNAQITIRQHDYIIYETYVPPGEFVINDIPSIGQGGDLVVDVKESDGSLQRYSIPYSSQPNMLREGQLKYNVNFGKYKSYGNHQDVSNPFFYHADIYYGLPRGTTLYGGFLLAPQYHAVAFGIGQALGRAGSLSSDITRTRYLSGDSRNVSGLTIRNSYQKKVVTTDTMFSISNRHYYNENSLKFSDSIENASPYYFQDNKISRTEISLTQNFGRFGNLSSSVYKQKYRGNKNDDLTYHFSYYKNILDMTFSIGYYQSKFSSGSQKSLTLNVNIPISNLLPGASATYSMSNDTKGHSTHQVGFYDSVFDEKNLSYGIQQGYDNNEHSTHSNVSLDYRTNYGDFTAAYGHDNSGSRVNYGVNGGIVATQYGTTLSQPLSDTMAFIEADGATHVKIDGSTNISTDKNGHAVITSLSPYHMNTISLNTETLGDDLDIEQNSQSVIPMQGAVVLAKYKLHKGARILADIHYHGKPVPFGADAVINESSGNRESSHGIVAESGRVYLSGVPEHGVISVSWNQGGNAMQCSSAVNLDTVVSSAPIKNIPISCN